MIKRLFDIFFSFFGLIIISPFFILICILIVFDSKGSAFYLQKRVGLKNIEFSLFKFRTMVCDADKKGLLTVGAKDNRITKIGYYLRKYKIDELPQLLNVFFGKMSFVGPRPEVRKYVDFYTEEQLKVLSVKPGITDFASIEYFNENELLEKFENPEEFYINEVMPAKLKINLKYIKNQSIFVDVQVIFKTILRIFFKSKN